MDYVFFMLNLCCTVSDVKKILFEVWRKIVKS